YEPAEQERATHCRDAGAESKDREDLLSDVLSGSGANPHFQVAVRFSRRDYFARYPRRQACGVRLPAPAEDCTECGDAGRGGIAAVGNAQWFGYPTPGIPRLPNGKANLAAPAPKTADGHPDLSGVWSPNTAPLQVIAPDSAIPFQPWAKKLTEERADGARGKD